MSMEQNEAETNDAAGDTDLRATLSAAWDKFESTDKDETPAEAAEAPTAPAAEAAPEAPPADPEAVGRPRDEHGRFAKGEKTEKQAPEVTTAPAQSAGSAGASPGLTVQFEKPPAALVGPSALGQAARRRPNEVMRREVETTRVLQKPPRPGTLPCLRQCSPIPASVRARSNPIQLSVSCHRHGVAHRSVHIRLRCLRR
jgi:hypothetical protein